ncbi:MAG: hypothetical protein HKM93_11075 [Desulfobacteraceae bacterium]|nr:hypothetical protein [Desulfobacteraceae bacterium]
MNALFSMLLCCFLILPIGCGGGGGGSGTANNDDFYNVVDYSPFNIGDNYTYRKSPSPSPVHTKTITGTEMVHGVEAVKVEDGSGDYELWSNTDGIRIHKIVENGGADITLFDTPVTMIPAQVTVGETYTFDANFTYEENGVPANSGTYSGEVYIEGFEDITVPAGEFQDCLKVVTEQTWVFNSPSLSINFTSTLWIAYDVGDVFEEIESNLGTVTTDTLISAVVDGVLYP